MDGYKSVSLTYFVLPLAVKLFSISPSIGIHYVSLYNRNDAHCRIKFYFYLPDSNLFAEWRYILPSNISEVTVEISPKCANWKLDIVFIIDHQTNECRWKLCRLDAPNFCRFRSFTLHFPLLGTTNNFPTIAIIGF